MDENNDLPEIPNLPPPDDTTSTDSSRRRSGIILGGLTAGIAMCCVAVLAVGWFSGAISFDDPNVQVTAIPTAGPVDPTPVFAPAATSPGILDSLRNLIRPATAGLPQSGTLDAVAPTPDAPQGTVGAAAVTPVATEAGLLDKVLEAITPSVAATPTASLAPTPAVTTADKPTITALPVTAAATARQKRVLVEFWTTVNDNYLYPDFKGVNWAAARADLEAKVAQGMNDEDFYTLLGGWIDKLGDNHSFFLSPAGAKEEDQEYSGSYEYPGIGVITEVNKEKRYLYVLQVITGSPAEQAGLRPHDHILTIDGQPSVNDQGEPQSHKFRGAIGTQVLAGVRTPGGQPRDVILSRANINASERVDAHMLQTGGKKIGYILIPTLFEEDIDARVRQELRTLMNGAGGKLDGLIIDMRINGGGSLDVLKPALGFFMKGEAGRLASRKGAKFAINIKAESIGNSQKVPLVVLTGPSTESYAEVFAGALQARGRARLVGLPSAGNIETLRSHEFEDGARLWLAEEAFRLPDGGGWEGAGLSPDLRVENAWDSYGVDNDPVIGAATELLQSTP